MDLAFGWWDHFEKLQDVPFQQQYEDRIELVQLAESLGISGYHVAEHHFSDLDMAPSPLVLLSALARSTSKIRLGTLVLCLPLYHPTRLLQELCLVDQLSNGRLDPGVGRGIRDIDHIWLGSDPMDTRARYEETLEILQQGLQKGRLNHKGKYFEYDDVEVRFQTIQKPLRFWYAGNYEYAARNGMNCIGFGPDLDPDRYMELFAEGQAAGDPRFGGAPPRIGSTRHLFIAETDEEANAIAARAWKVLGDNFWSTLVSLEGQVFDKGHPAGFGGDDAEAKIAAGWLLAGSPKTVTERLAEVVERGGENYNYLVNSFQWGDLSHAEAKSSLNLFGSRVMPELNKVKAVAA